MGLTGYGAPGRDGQLPPEPREDEAKRQAAGRQANRPPWRTWLSRVAAAALVLAVIALVVLFALHFV